MSKKLDALLGVVGESAEEIRRDPEAAYERVVSRMLARRGVSPQQLDTMSLEEAERALGVQ